MTPMNAEGRHGQRVYMRDETSARSSNAAAPKRLGGRLAEASLVVARELA